MDHSRMETLEINHVQPTEAEFFFGKIPENGQMLEEGLQRPVCNRAGCFKRNLYMLLIFGGVALGLLLGITLRFANPSTDAAMWIGLPGELLMNMLKALIVPLIVCTLITGTARSDPQFSGRITILSFGFLFVMNCLGVLVGTILAVIHVPELNVFGSTVDQLDSTRLSTQDIFADTIRNLFPSNLVGAAIQKRQTKYAHESLTQHVNVSGETINVYVPSENLTKTIGIVPSTNILGLIVCSVVIGMAASSLAEKSAPFTRFCGALCAVIFKIFNWVKWYIPIGMASLIAKSLINVQSLTQVLATLAVYLAIFIGGILFLDLLVYPLIYFLIYRKGRLADYFINGLRPALVTFGPPSSVVALPDMLRMVHQEYHVDPRVCGFVGPLACSLGRCGSGLFIAYTLYVLSKMAGVELTAGYMISTGAIACLATMAVPAVPAGSVVTILIIMASMGIPASGIGIVMSVDWLCDRIRSVNNVHCQFLTHLFVWRFCKNHLPQQKCDQSLETV